MVFLEDKEEANTRPSLLWFTFTLNFNNFMTPSLLLPLSNTWLSFALSFLLNAAQLSELTLYCYTARGDLIFTPLDDQLG